MARILVPIRRKKQRNWRAAVRSANGSESAAPSETERHASLELNRILSAFIGGDFSPRDNHQ
jgi:hypothetical protein